MTISQTLVFLPHRPICPCFDSRPRFVSVGFSFFAWGDLITRLGDRSFFLLLLFLLILFFYFVHSIPALPCPAGFLGGPSLPTRLGNYVPGFLISPFHVLSGFSLRLVFSCDFCLPASTRSTFLERLPGLISLDSFILFSFSLPSRRDWA